MAHELLSNEHIVKHDESLMHEEEDSLEHINILSSSMQNGEKNRNGKSGIDILKYETGIGKDPWGKNNIEEMNSIISMDYSPPCPWFTNKLPYCCIVYCCCFWSNYDRKQCSLALLYTKFYLSIYVLSILITVALLIYDVSNGSIANSNLDKEPLWFISLDIFCVGLMVFDIIIQIQANGFKKFFVSLFNLFDFIIVTICLISIPIYWFAPDWILSMVLLARFIVRMLRIITVIRHQKFRKEYIDARDAIVDFTSIKQNIVNESAINYSDEQFL